MGFPHSHLFLLVLLAWGAACAQAPGGAASIYTCVDAKGRKLTSDRPILDCIDREQKELNPSGTVRRAVGPSLTAEERLREEEKERLAAEERLRQAEEKRRDRALISRYPDRAAHDKERSDAQTQVDAVIKAANKRIEELHANKKRIEGELEFYKKDLSKMPPSLKRQVDENESSMAVQKRFITDQEAEKKRVNMRFDEELVKLKPLWAMQGVPGAAPTKTAAASAAVPAGRPATVQK